MCIRSYTECIVLVKCHLSLDTLLFLLSLDGMDLVKKAIKAFTLNVFFGEILKKICVPSGANTAPSIICIGIAFPSMQFARQRVCWGFEKFKFVLLPLFYNSSILLVFVPACKMKPLRDF